jgi:hypothetical protein
MARPTPVINQNKRNKRINKLNKSIASKKFISSWYHRGFPRLGEAGA